MGVASTTVVVAWARSAATRLTTWSASRCRMRPWWRSLMTRAMGSAVMSDLGGGQHRFDDADQCVQLHLGVEEVGAGAADQLGAAAAPAAYRTASSQVQGAACGGGGVE